jgi:hypothetical protein
MCAGQLFNHNFTVTEEEECIGICPIKINQELGNQRRSAAQESATAALENFFYF